MANTNIEQKHTNQYLTNFAVKYRSDSDAADFIAPPFKVKRSSDKYLVYEKRINRVYDNKLGRRAPILEIDLQANEENYSCEEYGLAEFVYKRDIKNVDNPIRLKEEKIENVKDAQIRAREFRVFAVAASTALVPNAAATTIWSNIAAVPITDIRLAMIQIDNGCGRKPNRIVMNYQAALNMINTTEWKGMFQYTETGYGKGLWSAIDGLRNLGLDPMITGSRGVSSYEGCSSDPDWETMLGNKVLIYHAQPRPTMQTMTFMSSPFTEKDVVREFWKEEDRGWKYTITEDIDELLVASSAGYLITSVY